MFLLRKCTVAKTMQKQTPIYREATAYARRRTCHERALTNSVKRLLELRRIVVVVEVEVVVAVVVVAVVVVAVGCCARGGGSGTGSAIGSGSGIRSGSGRRTCHERALTNSVKRLLELRKTLCAGLLGSGSATTGSAQDSLR